MPRNLPEWSGDTERNADWPRSSLGQLSHCGNVELATNPLAQARSLSMCTVLSWAILKKRCASTCASLSRIIRDTIIVVTFSLSMSGGEGLSEGTPRPALGAEVRRCNFLSVWSRGIASSHRFAKLPLSRRRRRGQRYRRLLGVSRSNGLAAGALSWNRRLSTLVPASSMRAGSLRSWVAFPRSPATGLASLADRAPGGRVRHARHCRPRCANDFAAVVGVCHWRMAGRLVLRLGPRFGPQLFQAFSRCCFAASFRMALETRRLFCKTPLTV